jgi:hypothetical protein
MNAYQTKLDALANLARSASPGLAPVSQEHRNRKSAGHIRFDGDFELFRVVDRGDSQVFRANRSNAFDLDGQRHGRWECSWELYQQQNDPEHCYCEDCGELIDSASKGCQNPDCSVAQASAQSELDEVAAELNDGSKLELYDHGSELPAERFSVYTQGFSAGCVATAATPQAAVAEALKELRWPA